MNKIVVIPDSFKGTMSSKEVGEIIKKEYEKIWLHGEAVQIEVADGGEGSVQAFVNAIGGEIVYQNVNGPYNEEVKGFYGKCKNIAIVEMAAAAGLPLVKDNKSAKNTTTFGVGQLMSKALDNDIETLIIALGGSATNDGGTGAACALGVDFYDKEGNKFIPVGATLLNIDKIDVSNIDKRIEKTNIVAMCDINNPLCGENGATYIFGQQKGLRDGDKELLDKGLLHLAKIIKRDLNKDVLNLQGAGAAGGMGAGCVAFFNAILQSGIDVVLDAIDFEGLLENCSLVISGEGRIDGQSARGKVVAGIGKRAKVKNIPVIAIVGDIADDADIMHEIGVSAIFSINRVAVPYEIAKTRAKSDLQKTARNIFNLIKISEESLK